MAIVLDEQAATTHDARSLEAERVRDDVDRRAREMIPRVRRARPRDARCHRRAVEVFVAEEIGGAGAEEHADARAIEGPSSRPASASASVAAAHADPIAARPAAPLERRELAVQLRSCRTSAAIRLR